MLASTFFAGINIGADTVAKQALDQQLSRVAVDIVVRAGWEKESVWSSENATEVANLVSSSRIEGVVETEVISRGGWPIHLPDTNTTMHFEVAGISEKSRVYEGLTVLPDGTPSLGVNETYVWVDSPSANDLQIGDVLPVNISVWLGGEIRIPPQAGWIVLNLTVAGFVELDDKASLIALGQYYTYSGPGILRANSQEYVYLQNLLIADWNRTFAELLDTVYAMSPSFGPVNTDILVYLDRGTLIGPWSIDEAVDKVKIITSQITNKVLNWGAYAENYLENVLNSYRFVSQTMRLSFFVTGIPVFFMAWYMGATVSDVSFNLRRREIGLLLTKGFSARQLLRLFLAEAFLIGLAGGILGVVLGVFLTPFFGASGGYMFSEIPAIGLDTVILALIFSLFLVFLSVFRSARRASKLNAVDALKEYRYMEEVRPYKRKWPWAAFILGSYKIIMLLLGINLFAITAGRPPTYNIIAMILLNAWTAFDTFVLGYGISGFTMGLGLGPVLFFWGLTKLLIRGSMKFQELTTKATSFLGDLGALATRNVQRNPARAAAVAFLIALILGYSVQIIGVYASERDFTVRQIRFNVGADISVSLNTLTNASSVMAKLADLSDVESVTIEYAFSGRSSVGTVNLRAVDPEVWLATAYYEGELFTGSDVTTAVQHMTEDNNTIVLERSVASRLNLHVNQAISLTFGDLGMSKTNSLKVVGFFGLESQQTPFFGYSSVSSFWSYVPEGFYDMVSDGVYASGRILVKLNTGADGKAVVDQIRGLDLDNVGVVNAVAEQLEEWQSNIMISGSLNVQRLGVAFAVLAASLGTALVTFVSLKERRKEVSIMCVRGLSFKQLITMLLTENLAVVVFAVLLGAVGGLLIVRGNVAAANITPYSYSPLTHHMVFPMDTLLTLISCFALVFISTIIPVIIMAKRYTSRLERIVREA
ncbi:MAG: FtsX-like permease family protein [Candidatus Bathyarchaeota archaeon]|nr:FtsX-like permease family protein [Candidatus Bathyarchaeota archaeon]